MSQLRAFRAILPALAFLAAFLDPAQALATPAADKPRKSEKQEDRLKADTFTGLELRGIGPAVTSGRVVDIAVHPSDGSIWYVAVGSGGVWKTTNAGTTWTPIFDTQGSYSIGCLAIDPRNPLVVWVGTGENNSQRSVGYGDGVYKSYDGGTTWENVGLKASEHIGKIVIDPRDSQVVYVAAQGPLWGPGGDRGLYKTTDGGKTWKAVLTVSENTGVSDLAYDPRHPDTLYAAAYQRRRHVWTLIDGGPESALYRSMDGGATWKKVENGLPKEEMGRIGLAVSPADPNVVYALVEAANKAGGFFRSTDAGGNWERMSEYMSTSPQYYQEIIADPKAVGRVYSMDTWMQVTEDGGKTFSKVGERAKHVDNHALVIDPSDTDHLLSGCDGGVYESWDRGANWEFKANLPVAQFYKVAVDDARPFYNVYGGTQDNNTLGGPSRTITAHGITNADWFVTVGGDGFQSQVDPEEPNIVYSQAQHGVLVRHDRKTGEIIDIQPQPGKGEEGLRWNWDSPLIISPHSHTRLYFAANRLFRSDDRGDAWRPVSPDLTRRIDRNRLKVMGRVFGVDSVAKNASTSFYGNIVALAESPLAEGLLYVGTDDGLIQVSADGGASWRKVEVFPGVPERTYVSRVVPSQHLADTVYAAFNNHKMADFKPYLLKSGDRGRTWTSIAGDLPERGSVWSLAEDHRDPRLLFAGTEFGVFFTTDGGRRWVQLKGKMPIIAVRDLAIQKRRDDLVVATFGRGFYILDDYSPLRGLTAETLEKESILYPVPASAMFIQSTPLGLKDKSFQGDAFYTAPNPPFGAVVSYYVKDEILTKKKARQKAEKETVKKGGDVPYPTWEALQAEDREEDPAIIATITDEAGHVVRRITGPVTAGFHRVAWDLRYPVARPTQLKPGEEDPFQDPRQGPLAAPGTYSVSLAKRVARVTTPLAGPVSFTAEPLLTATLPPADRALLLEFERKTARLQRAVLGAVETAAEAQNRIDYLKKALPETSEADPRLLDDTVALETRLKDLLVALSGDTVRAKRNEPTPPSIADRVQQIVGGHWSATSAPTGTHRTNFDIAAAEFSEVLSKLRVLVEQDLKRIEDAAEAAGAPWTPGRVPRWNSN
ncbi:MAG TPA: hypothetical protein VFB95_11170 [Candidatus Cryosericum sp.]|nr:hypothetical protein [Candidatus Cryosericum sp.]